jgi:hypothetical protein
MLALVWAPIHKMVVSLTSRWWAGSSASSCQPLHAGCLTFYDRQEIARQAPAIVILILDSKSAWRAAKLADVNGLTQSFPPFALKM